MLKINVDLIKHELLHRDTCCTFFLGMEKIFFSLSLSPSIFFESSYNARMNIYARPGLIRSAW